MITSLGNRGVKSVVHLRERAKVRREQDAFVTEGVRMFLEAPAERIREVYLSESFSRCMDNPARPGSDVYLADVKEKLTGMSYETVTDEVFKKMADTVTPQGILCVMKMYHHSLDDMMQGQQPLLLMLEDIQDPGNLGTMIRTGEGAGISGVVMSKNTVDIYNPKTIRSTMGSVYRVPFVYVEDLAESIGILRQRGVRVFAAHLKGKEWYDEADYTLPSAFLVGNEGNGLTDRIADCADTYIRIPMAGQVESLNAGVASSILLYEASRQRRNGR